mgnify:CR=1 FL=1
MKVYNVMCEEYDEAYHDYLDRYVSGPYSTYEKAQANCPLNCSSMGTSYKYYINEVEVK